MPWLDSAEQAPNGVGDPRAAVTAVVTAHVSLHTALCLNFFNVSGDLFLSDISQVMK